MNKTKNTNKGITLIALVITIIVMLILVAVTISMAVNGGLFEYASNAGTQTNAAVDAEQEFANLGQDMTVNQLIDKYTQNSNGCGECTDGYIIIYVGPNQLKTPCPNCSINFTVFGEIYTSPKGITWKKWLEMEKKGFYENGEYIMRDNYDIVHYEDGTKVSPMDIIRSRLCLYTRINFFC